MRRGLGEAVVGRSRFRVRCRNVFDFNMLWIIFGQHYARIHQFGYKSTVLVIFAGNPVPGLIATRARRGNIGRNDVRALPSARKNRFGCTRLASRPTLRERVRVISERGGKRRQGPMVEVDQA